MCDCTGVTMQSDKDGGNNYIMTFGCETEEQMITKQDTMKSEVSLRIKLNSPDAEIEIRPVLTTTAPRTTTVRDTNDTNEDYADSGTAIMMSVLFFLIAAGIHL